MKVLIVCLFSAFLAGLNVNLYAQIKPSAIYGKVLTDKRLPADAATIVLLKYSDSSIVSSTITANNGVFQFTGVPPDNYLLLVRAVGFNKSYSGPYLVKTGQTVNAPDIILSPGAQQLKEVSVISSKPEIEVQPGKVILNIQNSLLAEGNSAFDILRQSPGVHVDNSNNISITGRQSALITIDGKPTNLSGDDLVSILRTMQSNTIDRIELITSGSAKYDASGGGIINIVMKKGQNTGVNGAISSGVGYGKYGKSSAGIVFNDRTDKFNIFGNYNYSYNKTFHDFTTDRVIGYNNILSDYNTDYNSIQNIYNNVFSLGTDFFISPNSTIGFLVNGSITDGNINKDNNLKILNQSVFDSTITANSHLNRHISRINYNVNYSGELNSSGETISADFNYTNYDRSSEEYITNDFTDAMGNTYRAPLLLQNLSPSNIRIWLSKVDFADPISKTSKLEAGIKYSNVISDNELLFGPLVNGVYQSDAQFTNHFLYTENVNAVYVNYENKFDKFYLEAGLRAEQTIATGNSVTLGQIVNSNYIDLFPHALLTYKYDEKHDFSLAYNRGIQRPSYEDLNPFLYYVDLYDYRAGNQYLKPQYTNLIELSYSYDKSFTATLYGSIIGNAYNFPFYEQSDSSKVNITTYKNLGTVYNYGIKIFEPVALTNWWNADFFMDASYQRYVAYPENGKLNKGAQDIIFDINQHFIISKTVLLDLVGHYESPTFYGVNQFKATYHIDAGISKQLFKKRGSLKLNASDIFNTIRDRSYTNYQNLNITGTDKKESQIVRLTFTYNFGKTSVKAAPSHDTGNEDEQKRTGPTNAN
jgi:hypothetical protein